MAQIGTIQAVGGSNNANPEVELNNLAVRLNVRPEDLIFGGSYQSSGVSANLTQGSVASNVTPPWFIYSFIPNFALGSIICAVKKVTMIGNVTALGTGAIGAYSYQLCLLEGRPAADHNASAKRGTFNEVCAALQWNGASGITQLTFNSFLSNVTIGAAAVGDNFIVPLWDATDPSFEPILLLSTNTDYNTPSLIQLGIGIIVVPMNFSTSTALVGTIITEWDQYLLTSNSVY